jgi:hypothetical protein
MAGSPYFSSTYCKSLEARMLWIIFFLTLVVVLGVLMDSFRLFSLGLLGLLIKAFPLTTLSSIAATVIWLIKINYRR